MFGKQMLPCQVEKIYVIKVTSVNGSLPGTGTLNSFRKFKGGRKLFLNVVGLNCLQLKIIHTLKWHNLGAACHEPHSGNWSYFPS